MPGSSMSAFLLLVVGLAGKAAANPLPTRSNPCEASDSSVSGYWLSKRCYDLTNESESTKKEMYSICPMLEQQNQTFFPNVFNHETPQQALDVLRWLGCIMTDECHHHLKDFICHVYFPPCIDDICTLIEMHPDENILVPEPVLPCESMCSRVTRNCEKLLTNDLIPPNLAQQLQCTNFPKEETALCIMPVTQQSKKPKTHEGSNVDPCWTSMGKLKHGLFLSSYNPTPSGYSGCLK